MSIASLIASPERPDAAIICTPNQTHVPIALELIAAGIQSILVEKPISTTISEGVKLIAAAREGGVKVLVGHHRRFNPYLLAAKRCVDSGSLGKIIAVQGSWCLQKVDPYFDGIGEWRRSRANGGVVLINLIHEVDLLQYLLGPIVTVSAFEAQKTREHDAEEGAAVILRFESGTIGTFILSDCVPSPWAFEVGTGENPMIPQVEKDEGAGGFYRLMGTRASLSVPDLTRWSYDGGKQGWTEILTKEELMLDREIVPFDEQMKHFVGVVRGDQEPSCTGEEALRAMVVCEAIKRSMSTGKQMRIVGFEVKED